MTLSSQDQATQAFTDAFGRLPNALRASLLLNHCRRLVGQGPGLGISRGRRGHEGRRAAAAVRADLGQSKHLAAAAAAAALCIERAVGEVMVGEGGHGLPGLRGREAAPLEEAGDGPPCRLEINLPRVLAEASTNHIVPRVRGGEWEGSPPDAAEADPGRPG